MLLFISSFPGLWLLNQFTGGKKRMFFSHQFHFTLFWVVMNTTDGVSLCTQLLTAAPQSLSNNLYQCCVNNKKHYLPLIDVYLSLFLIAAPCLTRDNQELLAQILSLFSKHVQPRTLILQSHIQEEEAVFTPGLQLWDLGRYNWSLLVLNPTLTANVCSGLFGSIYFALFFCYFCCFCCSVSRQFPPVFLHRWGRSESRRFCKCHSFSAQLGLGQLSVNSISCGSGRGFYFEQSVPWFHFFVKDSVYSVLQHLLLLSA